MNINFYVHSLTDLRYLIPIAKIAKKNNNIFIEHGSGNTKYNDIFYGNNYNILVNIIKNHLGVEPSKPNNQTYDSIFSVECQYEFYIKYNNHPKYYSIQHGFDCTHWKLFANPKTIYLMSDNIYANLPKCKTIIINPFVTFLDIFKKTDIDIFVFYPEKKADHPIANRIIDYFLGEGKSIIIKQRAKSDKVPNQYTNITKYDETWYPSESIIYPLGAKICIGFGTSAYFDLAPCGIKFLDISLPEYSKSYIKPKYLENYYYLDNRDGIDKIFDCSIPVIKRFLSEPNPIIDITKSIETINSITRS